MLEKENRTLEQTLENIKSLCELVSITVPCLIRTIVVMFSTNGTTKRSCALSPLVINQYKSFVDRTTYKVFKTAQDALKCVRDTGGVAYTSYPERPKRRERFLLA